MYHHSFRSISANNHCGAPPTVYVQELLRQNSMAPSGQRFDAVMEVLVHELLQERIVRSRVPSSVSIASLRDSKGRRRQVGHQQGVIALDLPRSMGATFSKSVGDLAATGTGALSDISGGTNPKGGTQDSALAAGGGSSSELFPGDNATEPKERCKTRYAHSGLSIQTSRSFN